MVLHPSEMRFFLAKGPLRPNCIWVRCALGNATDFLVLYKLQATVDIKGESPNLCLRKSLLPAAVIDSTRFRLVAFNLRLYLLNCTPACSKLISEKVFRKNLPSYSKSKFNNNHACVDVSNFISIGNTNSTKIWNSPTVQCTRFVIWMKSTKSTKLQISGITTEKLEPTVIFIVPFLISGMPSCCKG